MVRIAIVYYSSTGNTYQVARAAEDGAKNAGAETRLRRVRELAPPQAIASNPAWQEHSAASKDIPEATLDDPDWADGYMFGTPTRFGNVAAQMKQFLDTAGPSGRRESWPTRRWPDSPGQATCMVARSRPCLPSTTPCTTGAWPSSRPAILIR